LYYISSFANPVLTLYRCYVNGFNTEPSNTNKYITGTLNKGQPLIGVKGEKGLRVGKGKSFRVGKGRVQGDGLRMGKRGKGYKGGEKGNR
jgi:hypothetical protein